MLAGAVLAVRLRAFASLVRCRQGKRQLEAPVTRVRDLVRGRARVRAEVGLRLGLG